MSDNEPPDRDDAPVPTHVGKYEVRKALIITDFSDIYLARDPDLDIDVAVKRFHIKGKNTGEDAQYGEDFWRQRFLDEARVLARLDHPHIVPVLGLWDSDGDQPYFAMPFVEANLIYEVGEDEEDPDEIEEIPEKWRPKKLIVNRAVQIWTEVLSGLAHLHKRGMVHRDLKPANILLTAKRAGKVKLCDFGMIKTDDTIKDERSGIWIGTRRYMPPEQRKSAKEVDARADVYSAGAVAFRMLTAKCPGDLPKDSDFPRTVPEDLRKLVRDCLNKKAAKRPVDAGRVLGRLQRIKVPRVSMSPVRVVKHEAKPKA